MIAIIDSGEYAGNGNLSYPKVLGPLLCSGIQIGAYAYAPSEDRYPEEQDIDTERRSVEKVRWERTANFLNVDQYQSWKRVFDRFNRYPFAALIIAIEEGVNCEQRFEILEAASALGKRIPVLTLPPRSLESAQSLAALYPDIVLWNPLRFTRGITSAKVDLETDFGEISSCNASFGSAPYHLFLREAAAQFIDLILHLMGPLAGIHACVCGGRKKAPAIAISARHNSAAVATYLLEANRFFQKHPHTRFEITSRNRELIVIDDSGLRRKSRVSRHRSEVPGFSHDYSSMEPGQTLLHLWLEKIRQAPEDVLQSNWLPTINEACETMKIIAAIEAAIEKEA